MRSIQEAYVKVMDIEVPVVLCREGVFQQRKDCGRKGRVPRQAVFD